MFWFMRKKFFESYFVFTCACAGRVAEWFKAPVLKFAKRCPALPRLVTDILI
jgi:hypothetical protein